MRARILLGMSGSALVSLALSAGTTRAEDAPGCDKLQYLLGRVDTVLAEWSDSRSAQALSTARLSLAAMQAISALESSGGPNFPSDDVMRALAGLRDAKANEAAKADLLRDGLVVASAMPTACPATEVPDIAAHAE